jgi:hypothetical protein
MKIRQLISNPAFPQKPRATSGATLVEAMVTVGIGVLGLAAVLSSHLMGLKMYNISATKLCASAGSRSALNKVMIDVRTAKNLYVGTGSEGSFKRTAAGSKQVGNALLIEPFENNTNVWIRYFIDPSSKTLRRKTSTESTRVISNYITNTIAFQAEDHRGTVLTNDSNNRVVRMLLEFYQWEFPVAKVGGHYDYFRLQTRIAKRALD